MLWTLAIDHRDSFRRGFLGIVGAATVEDVATARRAKGLVLEALLLARTRGIDGEPAILVDEEYGADVIARARAEGLTVVVPVEASGRAELAFEHGDAGWPAAIERVDPTYVKVLIRHNPQGDPAANARQVERLTRLQDWLDATGRDWMLELLVHPTADTPDDWDNRIRPGLTADAVDQLVDAGLHPAFWKLEGMPSTDDFAEVAGRTGGTCLVLGRGADAAAVDRWLTLAAGVPGYGGFAVGRTLWWQPLRALLDGRCSEEAAVEAIAADYLRIIDLFTHEAKAAHVDRS
jgi:myo-inositol catabolism protein IolC